MIHPFSKHHYYRCEHCDFVFKSEAHLLSAEEELQVYNYHNNSIEDPSYVAYFKRFVDAAVVDYATIGKKGLDFGSGPSPVLAQILERDYGYDMDIYDLFYAPDKIYLDQKYDLITSTEVVEHFINPVPYFQLFHDLLKEDGLLAIMTMYHPPSDRSILNSHYLRDKTHVSFFSLKTLETVAAMTGLEVVYTDHKRYTAFRRRGK